MYCEVAESRSAALRREYAIKRLAKSEKERLVSSVGSVAHVLLG